MTGEVAFSAAVASTVAIRWWRRRQRRRRWADQLALLEEGAPHGDALLSPALSRLADHAGLVRLQLATPLRRFDEPLVSDTPWGRRRRCLEYDLALINARRALWEWLASFRSLAAADLEVLTALGLSLRPFRGLLFRPGIFERSDDPFEQGLYPAAPDPNEASAELFRAMRELDRFERALRGHRSDPYRD